MEITMENLGFDLNFFSKLQDKNLIAKTANKLVFHSKDFVSTDGELDVYGIINSIVEIHECMEEDAIEAVDEELAWLTESGRIDIWHTYTKGLLVDSL